MKTRSGDPENDRRLELLRRGEQGFLATLVLLAIIAIAGHWLFIRAWHSNDLIEFDHAAPIEALFQVDLNRASWPEITQLPGIGETTARQIVKVRETGGPFTSLEELSERVHGVGPKMSAEIAPFVAPFSTDGRTADSTGVRSRCGTVMRIKFVEIRIVRL